MAQGDYIRWEEGARVGGRCLQETHWLSAPATGASSPRSTGHVIGLHHSRHPRPPLTPLWGPSWSTGPRPALLGALLKGHLPALSSRLTLSPVFQDVNIMSHEVRDLRRRTNQSLWSDCPGGSGLTGPPRSPHLPVLVLDHGIHDLLHLLGEVGRVRGELLSRWPAALLLLLALVVLIAAAGAGGWGGGAGVAVSLALP